MAEETPKFPSQLAERFQIRMPDGLRDRLRLAAEESGRSMNTEIVLRLERTFDEDDVAKDTVDMRRSFNLALSDDAFDLKAQITELLKQVTALTAENSFLTKEVTTLIRQMGERGRRE